MNVTRIISTVVTSVVSTGVGTVVGHAVKATTPADLNNVKKLSVGVGSLAIGAFVSSGASKTLGDKIQNTMDQVAAVQQVVAAARIAKEAAQNGAAAATAAVKETVQDSDS